MNLHVLANDIAITDPQVSLLPVVRLVLRRPAERSAGMDLVVFADLGPAGELGVRHDPRATANLNRPFDHHVSSDLHV